MKQFLIVILILISQIGFSQIREVNPTSIRILDLGVKGEQEFHRNQENGMMVLKKIEKGIKYDDLSQADKDALSKVDETLESYWDIIGGGCSWYCGGGPKAIHASSYLKAQGKNNYIPENAHDLNYKKAWAEGKSGYGIGEYLLYTFEASSPRITEINVVNGYVKSKIAWENNSRVKKLKVYIDEKPFAILNLKDIRGVQSFEFSPIGKGWDVAKGEPDWQMKFEILEVYKGLKYDDVVISEIYFDGIDVHCFAKGSKIQLADYSFKKIEDLTIGDSITCIDLDTKQIKAARIEKTEKVYHRDLVKYKFKSGLEITATLDHPFRLENNIWGSLLPEKSKQYIGFNNCRKINIGDFFLSVKGIEQLISIEIVDEEQETYTISKLSRGSNFIANGLVVGVEELKKRDE